MFVIGIEELRKVYTSLLGRRRTLALDGVSFRVEEGELFGLLGPNGAGKTTTIKIICGLVSPNGGRVMIKGLDASKHRREVMKSLSAVLEGNRNVYWRMTPRENMEYFGSMREKRISRERIDNLLKLFELWDKRDEWVQKLSRGMQQKTAIAVAIITDPEILLLDEPTLGLDVESAWIVKERIRELASREGKTIILTTHQMGLAEELCDRIGIIDKGKIVACDTVDNLKSLFSVERYKFEIERRLTPQIKERMSRFPLLRFSEDEEKTCIDITFEKPEEIYDFMDILRGLRILNIEKQTPDLEEVYLRIVKG